MPIPRDLGFRVAAFLVFVVFPVIGFVIRRKWRLAVARGEEINRLLVLASEEAARAELEATFGYAATVVVPGLRECPVCYTPANNRCARCKSVYYCSGKCQIIHWRQGHKDECRPPALTFEGDEHAINFEKDTAKEHYPEDYGTWAGDDGMQRGKQTATAQEEAGSINPVHFPPYFSKHASSEFPVKEIDDSNDALHGKKPDSLSEAHLRSVSSGINPSSCSDGMSVDDFTSDGDSSNSTSCDSSSMFDKLETASSDREFDRDVEQTMSSMYDNPEGASSDTDLKQTKALEEESHLRFDVDGSKSASSALSKEFPEETSGFAVFNISKPVKNSTLPSLSVSGFWDGSLDSSKIRKYAQASNVQTKLGEHRDGKLSDSISSPQYSSNSAANGSLECHSQDLKVLDDPSPTTVSRKLVSDHTLVDRRSADAASPMTSIVLRSRRSHTGLEDINNVGNLIKSGEVLQTSNASNDSGFSQRISRANDLNGSRVDTLQSVESRNFGSSPKVPDHRLSSGMKGSTVPAAKSAKAGVTAVVEPGTVSSTPRVAAGLKTSVLKVVEQLKPPKLSKQSDFGRNNEKAIFPYELFVKLWNKVELRPCGLINCGNSCYANVVLQCLAFTPPLTAYLLQGFHSKACTKKDWCFTCEFERLILKAKGDSSPISPSSIVSQIQKIGGHLANGREEDAHEFLRYAIDTMQSICLREAGVSSSNSLDEETTLIGLTFGGYLRSKVKCTRCRGKSERQERMMDLTVEIEGDVETLEEALRKFTRTESLDGENKYYCSRCKSYEKAKKKLSILEAPNVLTIALKRFQSGKFGKLNKPIRFPEILNLAPYMRGAIDNSPVYRLYGIVVHLDIMNAAFSGHYVSYVRNAQNKWYKTDDSTVKPVELQRVLNKGAYMLFYSRVSPRAPRSIRSTIVSRDSSTKIKHPEIDLSRSNGRNHNLDDLVHHAYGHLEDTRPREIPNILDPDSLSDSSSLFSHSDEVSSSTTDSTRESISDDFSDYIFGSFYSSSWRHSSDSDTSSSSSSTSSSPLYRKLSPLSNSERYSSAASKPSIFESDSVHFVPEGSGSGVGVPFLQSNSSERQVRKPVNSSSCSGAIDSERFGWANPSDNVKSGVYLRRFLRKKASD